MILFSLQSRYTWYLFFSSVASILYFLVEVIVHWQVWMRSTLHPSYHICATSTSTWCSSLRVLPSYGCTNSLQLHKFKTYNKKNDNTNIQYTANNNNDNNNHYYRHHHHHHPKRSEIHSGPVTPRITRHLVTMDKTKKFGQLRPLAAWFVRDFNNSWTNGCIHLLPASSIEFWWFILPSQSGRHTTQQWPQTKLC